MKVQKSNGIIPNDTTISKGDPVFLDITKPPFRLYGICEPFRRVPEDVAKATSSIEENGVTSVENLASTSAGVRVHFATDSDYIVIHAELSKDNFYVPPKDVASIGFDLYQKENGKYRMLGVFVPSQGEGKTYVESRIRLEPGMKDIVINFPLFASITSAYVALREGCELMEGSRYMIERPVVFYGSSIVHGSGVSRPGNNYPAIISHKLDCNFINLGFAGAAKAETPIIDYISGLDMSVFVYDYDHNAPNAEYLQKTHFEGYRRFRAAQPNTPVIMASKVDYYNDGAKENEKRRQIIMESYRRGIESGDKNLFFVDGKTIYDPDYLDELTADGCHPNDAGYIYMAKAIGKEVAKALGLSKKI